MQFFCSENRLERLRQRTIESGDFLDVTQEAKRFGFTENICVSKYLWAPLIQPYPFAGQADYLPLGRLLSVIKLHLLSTKAASTSILLLLPSQLPDWCRSSVSLRITVLSPPRRPKSIVVQHSIESFPSRVQHRYVLLPATLLVRLSETLRGLAPVARTGEQGLLQSMQSNVDQLIQLNPFCRQIGEYLADVVIAPPQGVPPGSYRSALFAEIDELLAIFARCTKVDSRPKVAFLLSHYRAIVSPLSHFCLMLEDLIRFTQSGANPNAPFQNEVFSSLLQLYVDASNRLQRLQTQVPGEVLSVVRFQLRLLTEALGISNSRFLAEIDAAFLALSQNRLPHPIHGPLHECRADVVWH